jgi:hypothetical protein
VVEPEADVSDIPWWRVDPFPHHPVLATLAIIEGKLDLIMTENAAVEAAVTSLQTEITTFLADVAAQLAGGLTEDQANNVISQINGFTSQLQAADPANATPPASQSSTTDGSTETS